MTGLKNLARFGALVSLGTLILTGCGRHDFPQYAPNYREYAYIPNSGSSTVTILDVVNVRIDRELEVGPNPVGVAASPTRNEVYVVNSGTSNGSGSVSVIDAEHNTVVATIPVKRQPVSIDLDSTGNLAYVANSGSNSISVIDLRARRVIAELGAGQQPVAARISPDRKTLVVTNRGADSVTIIDPKTGRVRSVFTGCPGAQSPVILTDSSKVFVACSTGHQVMTIALAHTDDHAAVPDRLEALLDVGHAPVDLALKPDGGEVFVSNSLSNSVSEIFDTTDEVGDTYLIGEDPVFGLVSRDNSLLYVANLHSQYVTVYSIDDGKRIGSVHVGDGPSAMAFSAAGHLLFVVDSRSDDVAVIRTDTPEVAGVIRATPQSLFTMLPTGRNPSAIVLKAFKVQ